MPRIRLMRYLITYDIPSDRTRNRVAKCLEGYGFRVQYSVFECELTAHLLDCLLDRLADLIDIEVDSVRCYPLCRKCLTGYRQLGKRAAVELDDTLYLF